MNSNLVTSLEPRILTTDSTRGTRNLVRRRRGPLRWDSKYRGPLSSRGTPEGGPLPLIARQRSGTLPFGETNASGHTLPEMPWELQGGHPSTCRHSSSEIKMSRDKISVHKSPFCSSHGEGRGRGGGGGGGGGGRGVLLLVVLVSGSLLPSARGFDLSLLANDDQVKIVVDNQTVYTSEAVPPEPNHNAPRHAGVHVVALHPLTGAPVYRRRFLTFQPSEEANLALALCRLQPGRVVVIVAVTPFLPYLLPNGMSALTTLGSSFISKVTDYEKWAMVVLKGDRPRLEGRAENGSFLSTPEEDPGSLLKGDIAETLCVLPLGGSRVLAEVLVTRLVTKRLRKASSTDIRVDLKHQDKNDALPGTVPSCPEWWADDPKEAQRIRFCDAYDGYGSLCSPCYTRGASSKPWLWRQNSPRIRVQESIAVVIVTANNPQHLYRLLESLLRVAGAGETDFLVVVDGPHQETVDLVHLVDLEAEVHLPEGKPHEYTRTNMNIRFALYRVFQKFPQASKAILLEDDLIVSPDFFSYFHQTAWLLDKDPSLSIVNAFGQNSFPATALSVTTVLRADMYPQYGWMTTRAWVEETLPNWVPPGENRDWDWWLFGEGRQCGQQAVVPEVSRTHHAGSAGAHVTGWWQHSLYNRRIHNRQQNVTLEDTSRLLKADYALWFESQIGNATKITLTVHPCKYDFLPEDQEGPFVVFLGLLQRDDAYQSFFLFQACLGLDDRDLKELYEGVLRLRVHRHAYRHAHSWQYYAAVASGTLTPSAEQVFRGHKGLASTHK
ncbi:protein O-linked-mannose beta-1,2-N-acetylglucosaminyltransferase 1-like isoform X2 [Oratosquilla oratoria]|uniref:protein O-linked-mannose beta-1,2-N-acetylglucosaminyltransferase 1-like isoform X2 n=1 Tax=Oratosquilla oratoria TaxID=337810 RepID=UPI003F759563